MNCPWCKKEIFAITGLQELQKFQKHSRKCKKNPNKIVTEIQPHVRIEKPQELTMMEALEVRAESGQ